MREIQNEGKQTIWVVAIVAMCCGLNVGHSKFSNELEGLWHAHAERGFRIRGTPCSTT